MVRKRYKDKTKKDFSRPQHVPHLDGKIETDVTSTGYIFHPNPLSSARAKYGDNGFRDGNNLNSKTLHDEHFKVILRNITLTNNNEGKDTYILAGPFASIIDFDAPKDGIFEQKQNDFRFCCFEPEFEAVNAYYHIDAMMRYINIDLDIEVFPNAYGGGVKFDPHGADGDNNPYYQVISQRLSFGEVGQHKSFFRNFIIILCGQLAQKVLYLSLIFTSYSCSVGNWTPDDEEWNWIFGWDGKQVSQRYLSRKKNWEKVKLTQGRFTS